MLKIIKNTKSATKLKKIKVEVSSNNVMSDNEIINQINSIKEKNQIKITKSKI